MLAPPDWDGRSRSYFMRDLATGCIKIGHTRRRVSARRKDLQIGTAGQLVVLGCVPSSRMHGLTERQLHRRFKRWSTPFSREWFTNEIEPDVILLLRQWGIDPEMGVAP